MQSQWVFKGNVILERFDKKALLVDLETEKVYELNESAARVAELIKQQPHTREEILRVLAGEFEVKPAEIEAEVSVFLEDLQANALVIPKEAGEGS